MTCIATAPVSPRRAYQYDTLGRPTSRTLARQGATRNDVFNYNDRSESPRRLAGGLDKTADGVRRVSLWCSYSPAKQGEGTMGCARSKPRSALAPQGRAGNGVPASQPTQPVATRPLAIQKDGTWYTYGWDLTKNIWEAYTTGYISTAYTYTAYGQVTASGSITQPIQWSSEYNDTELGLVYYNYRHYNPVDGKWIGRDKIEPDYNLYRIGQNKVAFAIDLIGRASCTIWTGMHNVPDQGFCPCPEHPQSIGIAFLNGEPGENEHFKNIASVNGRKAYYPSTGKDFLNELKRVTKENCGNCINILTIAGHGHSTCMTKNGIPGEDIENDEGFYYDLTNMAYHSTDATDIKNLKREISNRNIVFCKGGCLIQIYGCRIGRLFASELASVTGCNVVYASGSCFSDEKDVHTWLSGRGSYGEKNDNGEDYMGFMEALPDGTIRKIGSTNSNNISIYNPK